MSDCRARVGGSCNQSCAQMFKGINDERLGGTAEESHLNEERRLAHVAATRAKNKLVFTMFHDTRSVHFVFIFVTPPIYPSLTAPKHIYFQPSPGLILIPSLAL